MLYELGTIVGFIGFGRGFLLQATTRFLDFPPNK
jgi:hypothetical protein